MAISQTRRAARPDLEERTESFFYWLQTHTRIIVAAVIIVAAITLGAWLFARSREVRLQSAARSLLAAQQAVAAGNPALAQSDLERVVVRYDGTPAARQAVVLLAQIHYDKGEYQKGMARLSALAESQDQSLAATVQNLLGAGQEQMGKYGEAARHYERAAAEARFDTERENYLASAARAYAQAGNVAEAKRIWTKLAANPSGAVAAEARVRLGELSAQAVRRSS